jgi:hypothetical protein
MYPNLIKLILKTLSQNGYDIQEISTVTALNKRKNGETFSLEDHISGMVYALLSNQRPWKQIEDNKDNINEIFHNFNPDYLETIDPSILIGKIREIKCGNRSINSQMNALKYNINQFKRIVAIYGSMDNYVTSNNSLIIAKDLSSGEYKLKQMGIALIIEYLKNVGIDAFKPDLHAKRLFGKERLGFSEKTFASENEILEIIKQISNETNMSMIEIDSIIWQFCASNYGQICCAKPKCEKCLVKTKCNYTKHNL